MSQNIVLAVDDEPFNLEILEEILEDNYQVHCALGGPQCLTVVKDVKPNVILLDVSMPDMNGYEVCRQLKDDPETENIPVMFVSARGALDERIEGYNAGGEDYIVKPFAREELEAKLRGLFKIQGHQKALETQVQQATDMAFSAMSNSSEMGIVMQFVERTKELKTIEALNQALLAALASYGLQACIEFRCSDGQLIHGCSRGECSPIVLELFALLQKKGRIYAFEPRMMLNYPQLSILVMNMPQGDEDKLGRLRDHLCFISSSAEQCFQAILTATELMSQKQTLKQTISLVKHKFENLVEVLNQSHQMNESIFRDLQVQFEQHIPSMGLEDDQEAYIFQSLDKTIAKSLGRENLVGDVTGTFSEIEKELSSLIISDD
ncbi:MAG: DNA-binding response OmpR family regulator [Phenylobacterium sp.]|jgi:DNA-binding response OmpR family regulator